MVLWVASCAIHRVRARRYSWPRSSVALRRGLHAACLAQHLPVVLRAHTLQPLVNTALAERGVAGALTFVQAIAADESVVGAVRAKACVTDLVRAAIDVPQEVTVAAAAGTYVALAARTTVQLGVAAEVTAVVVTKRTVAAVAPAADVARHDALRAVPVAARVALRCRLPSAGDAINKSAKRLL